MAQAYYSPISINSAQVPSTQTDFPVLVSVTDARFKTIANTGHVANSSGFDIRPYTSSALTTAITGYELERYNASTGEVIMWVKVASLSSSTTPIYLGYGDASLTTNGSSTTTWSNNFLHVYHFKDGTTLSVSDSTGDLALSNNNACTAVAGQIDGAAGCLSASNQHLNGVSAGTANGNAFTFSAWVKATSFPNSYNCVMEMDSASNKLSGFFVKSSGKMYFYTDTVSGAVSYDGTGSHTLSSATWYYLTMAYDSTGGLIGYVNAASDGTVAANGNAAASRIFVDIANDRLSAGLGFNGSIDEVRMANINRSANWITTEYNNQSAPGTFETLGSEVSLGAGPAVNSNFLLFF